MKAALVLLFTLASACSTLQTSRTTQGVVLGGTIGAAMGAGFSPNTESTLLNALVFGLTGALSGGAISLMTGPKQPNFTADNDLKTRRDEAEASGRLFVKPLSDESLPEFVRSRISPLQVEEVEIQNLISEDGTLHENHKAYRIKRQPELLPIPMTHNVEGRRKK